MFKRLKNKKVILIALVLLLAFAFYKISTNPKNKTVAVKPIKVEKRVVKQTVSASGEIKSENEVDLSFAVSAKLLQVYVKEGDKVSKGKLMAVVDNRNASETAQAYKDARDKAIRQKELFVRNQEENEELLGGEEQYEIRLREYEEEISRSEAVYKSQLALISNAYIYAPFEGTVVNLAKEPGEMTTAGETIITLANLDQLYFESLVDQEDFGNLKVSMPATITLDAYPDKEFQSEITWIPLFVDGSETNSFVVKAHIKDQMNQNVLLGMTGDIKIDAVTTDSEVNSLYYDEIFEDEEGNKFVWQLNNGTLEKHSVEIGLEGDIYTEIKGDLGDNLVAPVNSDAEIKEGYKAKQVVN